MHDQQDSDDERGDDDERDGDDRLRARAFDVAGGIGTATHADERPEDGADQAQQAHSGTTRRRKRLYGTAIRPARPDLGDTPPNPTPWPRGGVAPRRHTHCSPGRSTISQIRVRET